MENLVTWGALAAAVACLLSVAGFWSRFSDRITKAEMEAKNAKEDLRDAWGKINDQAAIITRLETQIAREYIHRDTMRELENRLTDAIKALGSTTAKSIESLGERLDRFVESKSHKI